MKTVDACERSNDVLFAVSRALVVSIDHRVLFSRFSTHFAFSSFHHSPQFYLIDAALVDDCFS